MSRVKSFAVLFLGSLSISIILLILSRIILSGDDHVVNTGFSFGLGNYVLATTLSIISLCIIFHLIIVSTNFEKAVSLELIFIGGLSNLLERLLYGGIVDYWNFIDLWYFNISDLFISVGVFSYFFFNIYYFGNLRSKI